MKIPEKIFYLPDYPVPQGAPTSPHTPCRAADDRPRRVVEMGADEYLRDDCEAGLIERYGAERAKNDPVLRERLEYEFGVISKMGFSSYFLIVWDFIKYARDRDIPVGPGRGSAVGSLVSYCLKITDLDPIKFKLLFERFFNPERISMPDIDTDFCVERRDEVIAYVTEKYGKDRVAQIVTFGTMAARAAVRDAGRALAVPLPDVDRVAKLIPSGPGGLSISGALEQIPELKTLYDGGPQIRKLLDTANSIEGLARHAVDARRRRRDLEGPADRSRAAGQARRRRRQHAVRHGLGRADRPAQVRLPRAAQPDRDEGARSTRSAARRRPTSIWRRFPTTIARRTRCSAAARRWASSNSNPRA